ncbi:hypothetical protein [Sinomonas sp. ASV322]|nr:hypothetical protein [Sinomonas sp. ASV322]MDQ4502550.1 hypothetical protein [Sinomonas sp. ASV322]
MATNVFLEGRLVDRRQRIEGQAMSFAEAASLSVSPDEAFAKPATIKKAD